MGSRDQPALNTADGPKDNLSVVMAIGLLAYLSADIAHHVLGHGGACLVLGGKILLLTSIFVDCTVSGTAVDLAGPFANLAVGLIALGALHLMRLRGGPAIRLFLILAAGFNLLWFSMQLAFSAATRTDDFAWAIKELQVSEWLRYALIAAGGLGYLWSARMVGRALSSFATPRARAWRIVLTSWLMAGGIACLTAALDHHPIAAIIQHAAPQSLLLSIGLLFTPRHVMGDPQHIAPAIGASIPWVLTALVAAIASIVLLGPGISI